MGNRGILHKNGGIVRQYAGKRWVACTASLKPGDAKRPPMEPGHYTVLFFLDEATALAAGHRPCFTCRRKEYEAFLASWGAVNGIDDADAVLQRERVQRGGIKVTHQVAVDGLPDGAWSTSTGRRT